MCGDDSNHDGFDVMVCRELERWALAAPGVKASFIAGMLGYSTQVIVASLRRLERDGFAKRSRIYKRWMPGDSPLFRPRSGLTVVK